jgi:uncharacterized protein YceH (UPF0502 family)
MYAFEDNAAVMTTLERLAAREEPLTQLMQRQPGAREARWVHLLSGPVTEVAAPVRGTRVREEGSATAASSEMAERMAELEELVRSLEERVARLEVGAES